MCEVTHEYAAWNSYMYMRYTFVCYLKSLYDDKDAAIGLFKAK